jgi:photosystem II stability/assembly factor-like uncharacterized protein
MVRLWPAARHDTKAFFPGKPMGLALALLAVLACLPARSSAAPAEGGPAPAWHWRQAGYGAGGRFTAVAIDPRPNDTVYVGSDVAGLFRSRDGGVSFTPLGRDLTGFFVADILVDPGPDRLFVLTDDGLYVSRDQGDSLRRISPDIRYADPEPGTSLVLAAGDGSYFAATNDQGVYRVSPAGDDWSITPLGLSGVKVNGLALLGGRLFAATDKGVRRLALGSFEPMDRGLPLLGRDITDIAVQAGTLYCLDKNEGLFALAGTVWESRGPQPTALPSRGRPAYKNLGPNPARPGDLFIATHPSHWPHLLLETADGGRHWDLVTQFALDGPPNWPRGLESTERIVFSRDGRLGLLTDWWNVWRSLDGGHHWLQSHKGLQNTVVADLKIHPDDPRRLFLAVHDNGLMLSDDGGATWHRSMAGVADGHAKAVAFAPGHPDTVYLLLDPWESQNTKDTARFSVYRSDDGGASWRLFRFGDRLRQMTADYADGAPSALVVDPRDPNRVYVAVNGYGIYVLDTATNPAPGADVPARNIAAGIATPYFKNAASVLLDPGHPDTLYAATQEGGLWKTTDAGASWHRLPGPPDFLFGLAMDPADANHLFATGAEKTLAETRDGGASWTTVLLPGDRPDFIPASTVAFGPQGSGLVFVGTAAYDFKAADGLFASRDGGRHFAKMDSPLPRVNITTLAASRERPGELLVGFNGLGLYAVSQAPAP